MKKCKIRSKGVVTGSRDLLLEFWDSLHILGAVEVRNFKFGRQIRHCMRVLMEKMQNYVRMGVSRVT